MKRVITGLMVVVGLAYAIAAPAQGPDHVIRTSDLDRFADRIIEACAERGGVPDGAPESAFRCSYWITHEDGIRECREGSCGGVPCQAFLPPAQ